MSGTVRISSVVDAAARSGVIVNSRASRAACTASLQKSPALASALVMLAVDRSKPKTPALRATTAVAATPEPSYPACWLPQPSSRVGRVGASASKRARSVAASAAPSVLYPVSWAATAAGGDGQPVQSSVHAAGDTAAYIASQTAAAEAALAQSQSHTVGLYTDPHDLIAPAGGNAERLAVLQNAEEQRMRAGAWSR